MKELEIPFHLTEDVHYFPPPHLALEEPNGLLAIGGSLEPERLLAAYQQGIFPWFSQEPILWWSPEPRTVLFLDDLHISASMQKVLKRQDFEIKMDSAFSQVIAHCAKLRAKEPGTWITPAMQAAYCKLHEMGYAHSLEVYRQNKLIGGIYGVSLGKLFFGESMFSLQVNASKIALIFLVRQLKSWGFDFIDCQMWTPHLASMGASTLSRDKFIDLVSQNNSLETKRGKWQAS